MIKVKWIQKIIENGSSNRVTKSEKKVKINKNYKSFINEISKAFSIQNNKIILMVLTEGDDEIPINSQEDLDSYIKEAKEFLIFLEENSDKEEEEEDYLKEINFKVNLDISEQEIEKILDGVKMPGIDDINDDIEFDIDKYKNELNVNYKNKFDDFKNVFDFNIKNVVEQKSKIVKNNIKKLFSESQEKQKKNLESIKEEASKIQKDSYEIIREINDMEIALKELNNIITQLQRHKMIKFETEEIKHQLSIKKAKYFNIENIEISNNGNVTFKSLLFEIDTSKSSKDLRFYENSKNNNFRHQLTLNEPFSRESKLNNDVTFYIKDPKIGEYTIYVYIKETKDGDILSSPLKLTVNLIEDPLEKIKRQKGKEIEKEKEIKRQKEIEKEKERQEEKEKEKEIVIEKKEEEAVEKNDNEEDIDYKGLNKKDVDDMYNVLRSEFNIDSMFNKDEVISKIIECNCERENLNKWLEDKL